MPMWSSAAASTTVRIRASVLYIDGKQISSSALV
jgi:hypothetical protein